MIVGERKPLDEISESIKNYKKVLLLGCGTCVSVCMAGGEKEVEILASQLRMLNNKTGKDIETGEVTIQRQCDREYIEPIVEKAKGYDAVVSLACGAGVQFMADILETTPVIPAVNTRFIGVTLSEGVWTEKCQACGDCKLARFGGICPVTICAKGLFNGACGGSKNGKCEASDQKDCAWILIYNRLKKQNRLENLCGTVKPHDHKPNAHPALIAKV